MSFSIVSTKQNPDRKHQKNGAEHPMRSVQTIPSKAEKDEQKRRDHEHIRADHFTRNFETDPSRAARDRDDGRGQDPIFQPENAEHQPIPRLAAGECKLEKIAIHDIAIVEPHALVEEHVVIDLVQKRRKWKLENEQKNKNACRDRDDANELR